MELDDLKATWSQYDKKLSENLKLNEELLRKINLNSSRREFQKPLNWEVVNLVVASLIVVYFSAISMRFINELRFSIPGIIAVLIAVVYLCFSIIKVKRFLKIDYFQCSVVKLQKEIAELKQLVLRIRKYELGLMPFLVAFLYPIDIFNHTWLLVFNLIFVVGISGIVSIWINKNYVDKKLNNAKRLLEDIAAFEKEESKCLL